MKVSESFRVEYVEVIVNITHSAPGDLNIVLVSPSGTQSVLAELHALENGAQVNVTNVVDLDPIYAVYAQFSPNTQITGKVAVATNDIFCDSPTTNASLCDGLSGNIALIWRGVCTYITKVQNAQYCGATGVIVVNNIDEAPFMMGGEGNTIPAVMIRLYDGLTIRNEIQNGTNVEVSIHEIMVKVPSDAYEGWRFGTVRNWGEYSDGIWTIQISDQFPADSGVFHSWQLNVYGSGERGSQPIIPGNTGLATKWVILITVLEAVGVAAVAVGITVFFCRRRKGYQSV